MDLEDDSNWLWQWDVKEYIDFGRQLKEQKEGKEDKLVLQEMQEVK